MQIVRNTSKWGNSAGVLLPREWLGSQVKVILVERTLDIKKEALNILEPYLDDVLGVYLTGSYARGEQDDDSDIDIVVVSNETKKEIVSGKYHISIVTLDGLKKTLEKNPVLILPRLYEAKAIINTKLLDELKSFKINKDSFGQFFEESERIIKITGGFIKLDKEQGFEYLDSVETIYSLVLRLRGVFLIKKILKKEEYSKKDFLKYLGSVIDGEELKSAYEIYKQIRDSRRIEGKIKLESAEKLLELLKKEVKNLK